MAFLAAQAWREVRGDAPVVIPVGACEQHGPHLPLGTDTAVASALCERLAARRRVSVAPALPYGASGEHAGFAGTLSVGSEVLCSVLVELVRSADAFDGVVVVSAHGGNTDAIGRALAVAESEGRRMMAWSPSAAAASAAAGRGADAHAGWLETSVMLALDPGSVAPGRAEPGDTRPLGAIIDALRSGGVASVAPNGVLGDPTGASAELGRRVLDSWTGELVAAFDAFSGATV